jgi:hypothetical protein
LLILDKRVDNVRSVLENFIVHITLPTRETSPVCQDHQRQLFTIVEVPDGLCGLECGVRVPDSTCFVGNLLHRIRVSWVSRGDILHRACFNSDNTHGNATKASTANNNRLGPTTKCLDKGVFIEKSRHETFLIVLAANQPSHIVGLLSGWSIDNVSIPRVHSGSDWKWAIPLVWDIGHPLDDLGYTLEIIIGGQVRDAVLVHDLSATKLQVGCVDFATKKLVDGGGTSQDDWLTLDLDSTLAKADQVCTNTCEN